MTDFVIGVDESGTGAWAGPVYLAAVVAPRTWKLEGVRDSKKTTAPQRLELVERLEACCRDVVHVEHAVSPDDIEAHGHAATYHFALQTVVADALRLTPDRTCTKIIIDGNGSAKLGLWLRQLGVPFEFMKKADQHVQAVSAASIFAKFNRDVEMNLLDLQHPEYKFSSNAGYGTPEHIAAIAKFGTVPHVHRPITRT